MGSIDSALGTGWSLPLASTGGPLQMVSGEELVRQSITLILSTRPGEWVTRPEFGAGLRDLVFAPRNAHLGGRIVATVEEALALWEPRIDVDQVTVGAHLDEPDALDVEIDYTIRATNSRHNLVYPLYLGR